MVVDPGDTELFASRRKLRLDLAFNAITFQRACAAVGSFSDLSLAEAEGRGGREVEGRRGRPIGGGPLGETLGSGRHATLTRRARQDRERAEGRGGGLGVGNRRGGAQTEGIQGPLGEAVAATWQLLLGPGSATQAGLQGEGSTAEDSGSEGEEEREVSGSEWESESQESLYDRFKRGGRRRLGTKEDVLPELPLTTNIPPQCFSDTDLPLSSLASDALGSVSSSARSSAGPFSRSTTARTPQDNQTGSPSSSYSRNGTGAPADSQGLKTRAKEALTYSRKPPPWARGKRDAGEHRARVRSAVRGLLAPPNPSTRTSLEPQRVASVVQGVHKATPVLNSSQAAAVEASLERRLSLWQGPPGTGKTRTLVALVHTAAVTLGLGRVLACADR